MSRSRPWILRSVSLVVLALATTLGAARPALAQAAAAEEGALLAELESKRDEADGELVKKIAALRTPAAAKGLVDAYGRVASIYVRREILRALGEFDGVPGAGQTALDLVTTVAGNATEPEIRDAAFATLARCKQQSGPYLARLAESGAQEQVRERALELHAQENAASGASFYRRLFEDEKAPKKLRRMAFEALAKSLEDAELAKWLKDAKDDAVRRIALAQLASRKAPDVPALALDLLKRVNVLPMERAEAARLLLAARGAKAADDLIDVALQQATTPELLRESLAEQLGALGDEGVDKKLLALVGKGKPHEQRFALLAVRPQMKKEGADDKLLKKVRSHLDDKDMELRRVAIRIAGEQADAGAVDALDKLLAKPKDPGDAPLAVAALSRIRAGDEKWHARLVELSGDPRRDVRNAALQALDAFGTGGGGDPKGDPKDLALFVARVAHEDWSTRKVALAAIERRRDRDALGAVIAQMQKESGRMLSEFGDALFRLTGEPYDVDAPDWLRWWNGVGKDMPLITPEELAKKIDERERKRLRQTTTARFFGVKIESHDVAFVVDVSGSMAEPLVATTIDGRPATRMEVVKREIEQSLKALDASAFFNLITFNSAVTRWKDGVAALNDKTRAEVLDYVGKLGTRGGTNIYDALAAAFEDPRVDTIFLLTDGEPSAGTVTDLQLIREHVRALNENRKVIIHCIAVGGDFPLLEWIASDAGGTYVKYS